MIATATNTVVGSPISVGKALGVAVTPDGSKVYVTNNGDGTVSVIATATNTVVGSPITVGNNPFGVAVTPDGSKVYVANVGGGVSVIATATNTVIGPPITRRQRSHCVWPVHTARPRRLQCLHRQADGLVVPAQVHAAVQFHAGRQQ